MIIFKTPGLVDINALVTFGVNVKETDNPIGQFGTGFKYAVATILRLGGSVTVYRGKRKYEFLKTTKEIRGKAFDLVSLVEFDELNAPLSYDLGFTTQLGFHWLPWMAYRELLCNTIDERGTTEQATEVAFWPKHTQIVVTGANFDHEHHTRHQNFLFEKTAPPLYKSYGLEVWDGQAECVYFKRVRAYDASQDRPYALTYNVLYGTLTEDRTLRNDPASAIVDTMCMCDDEALLSTMLLAPSAFAESQFNWRWAGVPSDAFVNVVRMNIRNSMLNATARELVQRSKLSLFVDPIELNAVDQSKLDRAKWFCKQIGYDVTQPIVVAAALAGAGVLGYADMRQNKIILAYEVFKRGTKEVAQTLLEEHIHLQFGLADESRAMQEHLFQLTTSLGERAIGEAL